MEDASAPGTIPEQEERAGSQEENVLTLDNAGRGLAFMGIVLFIAYGVIFWLGISMPQLFNLFTGPEHFVAVSVACLAMVVGGYVMTKLERENDKLTG